MAKKNKANKKVTKPVSTKVEEPVVKPEVAEETKQKDATKEPKKEKAPAPVVQEKTKTEKVTDAPKEEVKTEEVKVEVVEDPVIENKLMPETIANVMGKLGSGERISTNSRILLMSMIKEAYLDHKTSGVVPTEISNSMTEYFNFEAMNSVIACMNQFKGDMEDAGIKVKPEAFDSIRNTFATYLDVKLIGKSTKDGQMRIDFKETMAKASPEAKEVIASEKKVMHTDTLPKFEEGKTEEENIAKIRTIFSMKCGMGNNLLNGVEFGRKAFNIPKKSTADVIATIISKLGTQPCILINSFEQAIWGSLVKHSNPFALHAWMGNILNIDDEKEVSDIVKVLLVDKLRAQARVTEKDCETEYLTPFSNLFSKFNDMTIDKLLDDFEKEDGTGVKFQVSKLLIDPIKKVDILPFIEKRYGPMPEGTGKDVTRKRLKEKLSKIAELYREPLSSFEKYVEKSNLAQANDKQKNATCYQCDSPSNVLWICWVHK